MTCHGPHSIEFVPGWWLTLVRLRSEVRLDAMSVDGGHVIPVLYVCEDGRFRRWGCIFGSGQPFAVEEHDEGYRIVDRTSQADRSYGIAARVSIDFTKLRLVRENSDGDVELVIEGLEAPRRYMPNGLHRMNFWVLMEISTGGILRCSGVESPMIATDTDGYMTEVQ